MAMFKPWFRAADTAAAACGNGRVAACAPSLLHIDASDDRTGLFGYVACSAEQRAVLRTLPAAVNSSKTLRCNRAC